MAASADRPSPEAGGRFRHAWRRRQIYVLVYAGALALAAGGGLIWAERALEPVMFITIPAVLLALGFAGTESTALHVEIRRESHSISLAGFPLLLGILALNPLTLVLARAVGTAFALAAVRGRTGVKLIWNLSLTAAETVLAVAIVSLATRDGVLAGVSDWLVLLGALLAAELLSLIAVPIVIMVSEGSYRPALFSQIARSQMIAAMSSASAVVIAAASAAHGTAPLVIGMAPFLGVALLLRYHGELGKKYDNLGQLHEFTAAISGVEPKQVGLQRLCETVRARGAIIVVPRPDGDHDVSALVDERRWETVMSIDIEPIIDGPIRVGLDQPGPASALLNLYSARNGMVADLPGLESGFVLVVDRLGALPRFTADEERLFGSMASTLGARLSADTLLRQLETQAKIDPLTGLANRATLEVELRSHLDEPNSEGAVLLIDLDRFKEVNDSLGHQFGDSVLCTVSDRLRETVGRDGIAARLGGDEFAVVLANKTGRSINTRVGEIADALARPIALEGIVLDLGGSIGVAEWPTHGRSATALLRDADIAMYEAKRTQRAWVRFETRLDDRSSDRLALMGELREAIGRGELEIHLQPQIRTGEGTLTNAEALVRWRHPVHGMISPNEFVSHAEHSNVAGELTRFVIDATMQAAVELERQGLDLGLSINLTSRDLLDRRLPAEIATRFDRYGLEPNRLTFEVTENSVISDIDAAIGNLAALRGLGCRTSIDDFGTGHASLGHLQRLPLDEAKIDRSFVTDVGTSPSNQAIVRSMTRLFHDLGLDVVAEGVEQTNDADVLRRLGCDLLQGYLFSGALALDDFVEFALAASDDTTDIATVTTIGRTGRAG